VRMTKTGVVIAASGGTQAPQHRSGRGRRLHWRRSKRAVAAEHEELARLVRERGGYDLVEVGYDHGREPSIGGAVESLIKRGAGRVVVAPAGVLNSNLAHVVESLQRQYPGVEIVYTQEPADTRRYADWIINKVREYDPGRVSAEAGFGIGRLGGLKTGETAVIHDFDAGHTLVSRLSALGFTPGARVTMIQNFGHGPVIVNVRDTRIALGRGEAGKIRVRQIGCGE
jgi:ferrous iron transport protein A